MEKKFVNGFESWQETHYEIVSFVTKELLEDEIKSPVINEMYYSKGTGGMYELCEQLTDEFEQLNFEREWNGEFFDEIEEFLNGKLYS
jgi:hypothetical protein